MGLSISGRAGAGSSSVALAHAATTGRTADDHHLEGHGARHNESALDELLVEDLGTGSASPGEVPTADGAGGLVMAAPAGGGALIREGSNTVEATTFSTVAVDLLSVSGLSIPATSPILVVVNYRKGAGAAATGFIGLKLNTTEVIVPVQATSTGSGPDDGVYTVWIGSRVANYTHPGVHLFSAFSFNGTPQGFVDGAAPLVTITDVVIRGRTSNAAIGFSADEMHVYSLATS